MNLPTQPVPAPGFERNPGAMPQTGDMPLRVQFANGYIDRSNTYTANQLRWGKTRSGWDVGAIADARAVP